MPSRERESRSQYNSPGFIIYLLTEREQRDPLFAQRRLVYAEQAQAITKKLETTLLTPGKRERLEWHLAVLNWRREHGPRFHYGYYDFNFLPQHVASANPQLKRPVLS